MNLIKKSSKIKYENLDKGQLNRPINSWPDFANNFLFIFRFFEGQGFSIWLFVAGLLVFIYGRYALFEQNWLGSMLKITSLICLFFLLFFTLYKNFIFYNPFELGYKIRLLFKLPQLYKEKKWFAKTIGPQSEKFSLPLRIVNFSKIYAKVKIINSGSGRWRAGFIFENMDGTKEYIFHSFQDSGNKNFYFRIVEREPGIREIKPDISKNIGIKDPHNFKFWINNENNKFNFYINGIFAGSYKVPVDKITNIILTAWSDDKPITILFENIEAWV